MLDLHSYITNLPLFGDLDATAAQALAAALEVQEVPAGAVLFCQDDPGDAFYIVASGKLCAILRQPNGQETCLNELGPGECVGEMALLTGQPRVATVIATQDSRLLRLAKATFDRLAEDHPQLLAELAARLLPRFRRVQLNLILTRLFGQLTPGAVEALEEQLTWQRLDCGQVLFRQGDPGDVMYIVIQGRLRFMVDEPGGGMHGVGEVGAGESIGEFALLAESGTPESLRSATVIATRLTDVVAITRPVFEGMLCQHPQALLHLTRQVIQRQRRISQVALPELNALVITLLPASPGLPVDELAMQLAQALTPFGATLFLDPTRFEALYGRPGAAQTPLDHPTSLVINAWLDEHERQQRHLLYSAVPPLDSAGSLTPWARRCLEDSDVILLVGQATADQGISAVEAALPAAHTRARLELVLLHPDDCLLPAGTVGWLAPRQSGDFPVQAHHHVRLGNAVDVRRLARRVSGRPVGLALSGGGARGWAHIGALRALEEAGIEVDWVAGASMGAIIAAGFAMDWPPQRLSQLAASFGDPKKLLDYTLPYTAITATRRITTLLQDLCLGADITDTWRPFFCVTANLTRRKEQTHFHGPLWSAVRASMAFPGIFAPVLDDGCVLIDGGAANNLPIDHMRQVCPTGTVIGVELVTASPVDRTYNFGPSLSGWQALLGRFNLFRRPVKAPSLLDIVNAIVDSNNLYRLNESRSCADLLIQIPVEAYGLLEFDKHAQIIELGYRQAKEQLT